LEHNQGRPVTPTPQLDVVIVNWKAGRLLRDCVAALDESTSAPDLNVVVVDNASGDGSADRLPASHLEVEIVRNRENLGFARACNLGAARGRAPFVLILNPDTRVAPDTLGRALGFLSGPEARGVGILGVKLTDDEGGIHRTCARAPTRGRLLAGAAGLEKVLARFVKPHFMVEWDHRETRPVDQVMGAFLMIRRELFERLGGFDERFFVYFEDVDLCVRARGAGAHVVHFAEASAWHLGGGTTDQVRDRRLFYFLRSQVQYAAKHFGRGTALLALAAALLANVPLRAARSALAGSLDDARHAVGGGWLLLKDSPALLGSLFREEPGPGPQR
jgi:GT2 family glycosyltransferase